MDYREADAIWESIVVDIKKLDHIDGKLTEKEKRLYKIYKEACEVGQIEGHEMFKLRGELNHVLKLRNL